MNRIVLAPALILAACTSSEKVELDQTKSQIADLESEIAICQDARREVDAIRGESGLAEWDIAAADDIDHISQSQEWEIRKSLGAEMGLAPSEVNGWKDIYRRRAEGARNKAAEVQSKLASAEAISSMACQGSDMIYAKLNSFERRVRQLERITNRQ